MTSQIGCLPEGKRPREKTKGQRTKVRDREEGASARQPLQVHYESTDLATAIRDAISRTFPGGALGVEDTAPIDEFHVRGREATESLLAQLHLSPGERVLDCGCGLGGAARRCAAYVHGPVIGLDAGPLFRRRRAAAFSSFRLGFSYPVCGGRCLPLAFCRRRLSCGLFPTFNHEHPR